MNAHAADLAAGPVVLSESVQAYVESIRGQRANPDEAAQLLESVRVDQQIEGGAKQILATGEGLEKIKDNAFVLRRANGAERLAFYVVSGLANWESFVARKRLKDGLNGGTHPYGPTAIDRAAGARIVPPVEWDVLQGAVAEAEDSFSTNMNTSVNPGKETMRAAGLKASLWDSNVYKFGTHPAILRIVSDYLGVYPVLLRINLLLSMNDRLQENSSQFPHLDPEDFQQMKIFLYVNDVDEESGPFQVLRADASDRVQKKYDYRFGRLTDKQLFDVVTDSDLIVCLGDSGTANFADTSRGFHFGSRPSPKQRKLIMYQYVTPFAASWPIADKAITCKYKDAAAKRAEQSGKPLSDEEAYLLGVKR